MTIENAPYLSLIISLLSFFISLATIYFSFIRPSKIKVSIGPHFKFYHQEYNKGMSTGFYIPVTFFNTSNRSSVIQKTAIEIYRQTTQQKRFFIHGSNYSELNSADNKWKNKEMAYAIPILGKSAHHKIIRFYWDACNDEKLLMLEGTYNIDFLYWLSSVEKPVRIRHEITIDSQQAEFVKQYREEKRTTTIGLVLDKELDMNKLLSAHESRSLLN
ncbi:hypothetical protein FT688_07970 [Aeromonas hydrophila]|nr:hypothetical protein FT688_07970 [Aeromonas hydrophila]